MATEDRRQKAYAIIERMAPAHAAAVVPTGPRKFGDQLGEMGLETLFVRLWSRDDIDLRTRSLITLSMLIAQRADRELAIHFPAAIRNGATLAEIEEVIHQASGYVGFPAAHNALHIARQSLRENGMLD